VANRNGNNPSNFKGESNLPVENVSGRLRAFCGALGQKDGKRYRLATEAEWELRLPCRHEQTPLLPFGHALPQSSESRPQFKYLWGPAEDDGLWEVSPANGLGSL